MRGYNEKRWGFLRDVREALDMGMPVDSMNKDNLIFMFERQIKRYRVAKEFSTPNALIKEGFEKDYKKLENELFWELLDKKAFGDQIL